MPPDMREPPQGCPFAPRCRHAEDRCRETDGPPAFPLSVEHMTRCLRVAAGEITLVGPSLGTRAAG